MNPDIFLCICTMQGGNQPIHLAVMNGCVDIVEYLVKEHSVSVNTAAIPMGDAPLFNETISVSEYTCTYKYHICISYARITSL